MKLKLPEINWGTFFKDFAIGGALFAIFSYISNNVNAEITGIMTGFPVGLMLLFFINTDENIVLWAYTHIWAVTGLVATYIFVYFAVARDLFRKSLICIFSILIWFGVTFLLRFLLHDKMIK